MLKLANKNIPWGIWLLSTCVLGAGAYFHLRYLAPRGVVLSLLIACASMALAALACAGAFACAPVRYRDAWRGRGGYRRAAAALVLGLVAGFALPLNVRPVEPTTFSVEALGTHHPDSRSSEVWARVESDGKEAPPSSWTTDGKWVFNGNVAVSSPPAQPATITWSGRAASVRLYFVAHGWSGKVRLTSNGQVQDIDLYRPPGAEGSVAIDVTGGAILMDRLALPHRSVLQWLAFIADALMLGGCVVLLFDAFSHAGWPVASHDPGRVRRSDFLLFSLPQCVAYLGCLLLFYPGIMTSDSLDQWTQSITGQWTDWHPPLYALLMAGVRKIWDSPAAIALIQCFAMAGATGMLITSVRAATGVSRRVALAGAILCALFPVVPMDVVTLWKDILYSAAVVFLIGYLIGIVCVRMPLLRRPLWLGLGFLAIVVCLTFRYNGLPFILVVLALVMVAVPGDKWRALILVISSLCTVHLINGPLLDAIGTTRMHVSFSIAVHHIAAHQAAGQPLPTKDDKKVIERIWSGGGSLPYNCAWGGTTIFDPHFNYLIAAQYQRQLLTMAGKMALARPDVELRHLACVSALVWRLGRASHEPIVVSGLALWTSNGATRWIYPNDLVREQPTLGALGVHGRDMAYRLLSHDKLRRPALFLYVLLFASVVAACRQKRWELAACVLLTVLAQSASIALFNVAQDPRYQLSVVIACLAISPMLLAAARNEGSSRRGALPGGPVEKVTRLPNP